MNSTAKTREYLSLRISQLQEDIKDMSLDNGAALAIEYARIEENKNALRVLNGGSVHLFDLEAAR